MTYRLTARYRRVLMTAALMAGVLTTSLPTQAGVVVGATRLVYEGDKKESSLTVSNPDASPYLIQSWVETARTDENKAPFILTPPLFRLDGGQQNVLRVVRVGGALAEDRETLYWLNVKAIPSAVRQDNTLQIAIKTRIKLIYRPQALSGRQPESVGGQLTWRRVAGKLEVSNPTPFYMNFQGIKVNGLPVKDATYVAPFSRATLTLPGDGREVSWRLLNDFGGAGQWLKGTVAG
jgi:P pilus assembly chaperone PapD